MNYFINRFPDSIQTFEPMIRGQIIANLTPDPFFYIQTGLVAWQILQTQSNMSMDKEIHFFSLMPFGSINIKPNRVAFQSAIKVFQRIHKSLAIALRQSQQALSAQQGSHPTKKIKPLAMLTGRRDTKPLPFLRPSKPQTRMQRETRFILKNNRFLGLQRLKFFLTPCEIAWLPRPAPEDRNNWPASVDIPIGASSIGPDEPSALSQIDALGKQPRWDHPNEPDLTQALKEISPIVLPTPGEPLESNGQDAQTFVKALMKPILLRLPCASKHLSFDASDPGLCRPIPDADPPVSATELLFLFQYRLPGFSELRLKDALDLPPDELILR